MFFARISRIVAILLFVLGALRVAMGVTIASLSYASAEAAKARYLGTATTGEAIDKGIYVIAFALLLGTLSEIALTIGRARQDR